VGTPGKHIDSIGVADGWTQPLAPSSPSQHVPPGQSADVEQVSGGWVAAPLDAPEPVIPLDAPEEVEEPLLVEPVLALPLPPVSPLDEPLEAEPLVVVPLPPADDPLPMEAPLDDAPLEPLPLLEPDEVPAGDVDPPHATNASAAIHHRTARSTSRAMSVAIIPSLKSKRLACLRSRTFKEIQALAVGHSEPSGLALSWSGDDRRRSYARREERKPTANRDGACCPRSL
jgi:hypothetical protein